MAGMLIRSAEKDDSVVDHVEEHRGDEASCLFEEEGVGYPEEEDREPGERWMVHGEEGGAGQDGAPAAPFAVESAVEQAAEQILLGEGSEADGHDG